MAPETRSTRSRPAASKLGSATIYSSAAPPKQRTFPSRRKSMKTYGKSRRSAPPRLLRQQTLTQMLDVHSPPSSTLDDLPMPMDDEHKKKRRKTMGDLSNMPSDRPTATKTDPPTSSFHTQTLTQFVRDKALPIQDSDDEDVFDFLDDQSLEGHQDLNPGLATTKVLSRPSNTAHLTKTQTPPKRTIRTEIPPSTGSVCSPMLQRYSPPNLRSSPCHLRSQRQPSGPRSGSELRPRNVTVTRPKTPEAKRRRIEIPESNESIGTPIGAIELLEAEAESPLAGRSTNTPAKAAMPEQDQDQDQDEIPKTPTRSRLWGPEPAAPRSISSTMIERYSPPGSRRSPLKEKSANASAAAPSSIRLEQRSRSLAVEVEDSFSPKQSPGLKSAMKKTQGQHTPGKRTRFILPEDRVLLEQESQQSSLILGVDSDSDSCPESPSPNPRRRGKSPTPRREVPDSDDESGWGDDSGETPNGVSAQTQESSVLGEEKEVPNNVSRLTPNVAEETQYNYGEIGEETQAFITSGISVSTGQMSVEASTISRQSSGFKSSPPIIRRGEPSSNKARESARETSLASIPRPTRKLKPRPMQSTQFESQRLSMDLVRNIAPNRAHREDVFVSIHPNQVDGIVDSTKNHEFRDYLFPETVSRLWVYATNPVEELKYMIHVGPPMKPGEIIGEQGLGNAEFNAGNGMRFAYEIIQVYELNNPVSLEDMKAEGWISAPPQRYTHIPPAVLGELAGNLRCDLFEDGGLEENTDVGMTVSQLVEVQIRNDLEYTTNLVSDPPQEEEVVPSSHKSEHVQVTEETTPRPINRHMISPPQNEDRSETLDEEDEVIEETPRPEQRHILMHPSQATTASQPSTPTQSPRKMTRRSMASSSLPPSDVIEGSPLRLRAGLYSYDRSSELLSKSQMLPESLLIDMNNEIGDSDEEESETED